jgi:hypothetical protein
MRGVRPWGLRRPCVIDHPSNRFRSFIAGDRSLRRRAGRGTLGPHLGRHYPLGPESKANEDELTRPQLSQAEPAYGLDMHENVGCALAASEEAESAHPIEPLHLRPVEPASTAAQ